MKKSQVLPTFYNLESSTGSTLPSGMFPIAPEKSAMILFNHLNSFVIAVECLYLPSQQHSFIRKTTYYFIFFTQD